MFKNVTPTWILKIKKRQMTFNNAINQSKIIIKIESVDFTENMSQEVW